MKKIYIILLFGLSLNLNAQPYKHCLDGGIVKWSIMTVIMDYGESSYDIVASRDTIINGLLYQRLGFRSFIRESEDASKLYVLEDNQEYLISDMNLQVGDEFDSDIFFQYGGCAGNLIVDSVYTKNGLKHVQFNCNRWDPLNSSGSGETHYKLIFIEGVGPNTGIYPTGETILNCFQNQSISYKNDRVAFPCGYERPGEGGGAISTILPETDYTVEVNENGIDIHFFVEKNVQLSVCNLSGKLYYNTNFLQEKNINIPTISFPQGTYLLKIVDFDTNRSGVKKLIL